MARSINKTLFSILAIQFLNQNIENWKCCRYSQRQFCRICFPRKHQRKSNMTASNESPNSACPVSFYATKITIFRNDVNKIWNIEIRSIPFWIFIISINVRIFKIIIKSFEEFICILNKLLYCSPILAVTYLLNCNSF